MVVLAAINQESLAARVRGKGKCPFGFSSGDDGSEETALVQVKDGGVHYPSQVLTCSKDGKVMQTKHFTEDQYEELANQIIAQQFGSGDKTKYAACLLRLAGHDLMDFRR